MESGKYRHFKGQDYEVLCFARHSETLEGLVVYQACYGDRQVWARPQSMFFDEIEYQGVRQPRFRRIE